MNEFQNKYEQSNYSEKVSKIAAKLAINKYNAIQGKINLDSEISGNIELVNNKIAQIYKGIESKIPGLEMPKNLNDTIAEYLLRYVEADSADIEQLNGKGEISEQIFKQEVLRTIDQDEIDAQLKRNSQSEFYTSESYKSEAKTSIISLSEKYHGVDDGKVREIPIDEDMRKKNADLGKVTKVFEENDGGKIVFIAPKDEKYKKPENEPDEFEEEIMLKQREIERSDSEINWKESVNIDELHKVFSGRLKGLGIDASIRATYNRITTWGVSELCGEDGQNNEYRRKNIYALFDSISPENARKNGYAEDSYTMIYKLGIFSRILNDQIMGEKGIHQTNLLEKMKHIDSELYAFIEKNPRILEIMQTTSGKTDPVDAMIEIFGNSDVLSREEFLEQIEKIAENNKDIETDKNIPQGYDKYPMERQQDEIEEVRKGDADETKRSKMPFSVLVENKMETIRDMVKKRGVGIAISSVLLNENLDKDKGETLQAIKNLFDFERIGQEGNLADKIVDKDVEIMKKQLQSMIAEQDDKKQKYILVLGDIINRATEREKGKVLSADKVDFQEIINMGEKRTDAFTGIKNEKVLPDNDDGSR